MDAIMAIARTAQAGGHRGRRPCPWRDLPAAARRAPSATWARSPSSPARTSHAAKGGIITTNDDALAEACRSIHNCGRIAGGLWYEHHVISANYRLGEFQGAVLNAQLDRLEAQTKTRDRNGQYLAASSAGFPGIHPQKRPADCTRHSYHLFLFRIDAAAFGAPRRQCSRRCRPKGFRCAAATRCRSIASRCS